MIVIEFLFLSSSLSLCYHVKFKCVFIINGLSKNIIYNMIMIIQFIRGSNCLFPFPVLISRTRIKPSFRL